MKYIDNQTHFMRRAVLLVAVLILVVLLVGILTHIQSDRISIVSTMQNDTIMETVILSDGYLEFESSGHSVQVMHSLTESTDTETVVYTYDDVVAFLQCDLIQVFRKAGVPERCIPAEENFFTEGKRLLKRERHAGYTFEEGSIWGGEGFDITVPDPQYGWISRQVWLGANLEGNYIGLPVNKKVWKQEPNSRVGDTPVYINYRRRSTPALGGYETDEFFACFDIAGYSYGLLTVDCTQEEFVTMLLAIINHYGAYPPEG